MLLPTVLACAAAAAIFKFVRVDAPKWLAVAFEPTARWAGVAALPQLASRLDPAAVALLGVGGLIYTAGGLVYARRPPDPPPTGFGYHELFPPPPLLSVSCQYVAIAFFVIHAG